MIRADYNVSGERYGVERTEPIEPKAEALAAVRTEEAALASDIRALRSRPSGPPSRMGEQNAGTDMLKARLLSTAAVANRSELANGQITTVYPSDGDNGSAHTIYINGINTTPEGSLGEAQQLADTTSVPIDDIYQHSSIGNVALREAAVLAVRIALLGPLGGIGTTIAQARSDLIKQLQNPGAANVAANQILQQLGTPDSSQQVRLIGYSQGATISAEALQTVAKQLTQSYGADVANKMLGRVHVLSLGGAARRSDFPAGIELTQVYHKFDIVSQFFGDNRTPLYQSLKLGADILKAHNYTNDPAALDIVNQWEQGRINNQDISLVDPKLRKAGMTIARRVPITRTNFAPAI